ncbi:MAG: hypothetical protein LQ345_001202 [Seirophora villosa]|nr:MAG: hypothetical protein LQ345_001202 [Seirophora villosa]
MTGPMMLECVFIKICLACSILIVQFETLHEEKTPIDLDVTGSIPAYAAGVLYRTGPGGHQVKTNGNGTFKWFDGFTQTHRFEIVRPINGANVTTIRYNSRHNCNKMIETIRTTGAYHEISFGPKQDPCQSLFRKAISTFQAAISGRQEKDLDEANVGVTLHDHIPGMPSQRQLGSGQHGFHLAQVGQFVATRNRLLNP